MHNDIRVFALNLELVLLHRLEQNNSIYCCHIHYFANFLITHPWWALTAGLGSEALIQVDVDLHEWNQLHLDLETKSGLQHDVEGRWSEYCEFSWKTKNQRCHKDVGWSLGTVSNNLQHNKRSSCSTMTLYIIFHFSSLITQHWIFTLEICIQYRSKSTGIDK